MVSDCRPILVCPSHSLRFLPPLSHSHCNLAGSGHLPGKKERRKAGHVRAHAIFRRPPTHPRTVFKVKEMLLPCLIDTYQRCACVRSCMCVRATVRARACAFLCACVWEFEVLCARSNSHSAPQSLRSCPPVPSFLPNPFLPFCLPCPALPSSLPPSLPVSRPLLGFASLLCFASFVRFVVHSFSPILGRIVTVAVRGVGPLRGVTCHHPPAPTSLNEQSIPT